MKEVKAYIKQIKLPDVVWALHTIEGLTGLTMTEVYGHGRGKGRNSHDRVRFLSIEAIPRVKLEIVCADDLVETIVSTIQRAAHTGQRGDGKIYVSEVAEAVRISTNEYGSNAA